MGRPFEEELRALRSTLAWARTADVTPLREFIEKCDNEPLYAVGVGGSFTAATLATGLQRARGGLGIANTTLEFCSDTRNLQDTYVLLFTGAGNNHDILRAFDHAVASEAKSVVVVCASKKSRIKARVKRYWDATLFDFDVPARRDGFLATNTLLGTCTLVVRAYGQSVTGVMPPSQYRIDSIASWARRTVLEQRETLLVLYSSLSSAAAIDFESKCSEAGLVNVLLSDYRHFAHGRHHWLAKRGTTSAVVAFMTQNETEIATKTLSLLPNDVPILRLKSHHGHAGATLDLLMEIFYLVGALGCARGFDPGRPRVPLFGRRIYNLRVRTASGLIPTARNLQQVAVNRKTIVSVTASDWDACYESFLTRISTTRFSALVFDFDGTLCSAKDRMLGISTSLQPFVVHMARHGIQIGIATGRGKSACSALRKVFPKKLWSMVVVGYYNGASIAALTAEPPNLDVEPVPVLRHLHDHLEARGLEAVCQMDLRPNQLSIAPRRPESAKRIANILNETVAAHGEGSRLVYSSHSFDVLAPGVTKLRVVDACSGRGPVLCLGDRGAWPGNDFQLLSTPHSLSVDTVSADPKTCWNLAPPGVRCVQATCFYLAGLKVSSGSAVYSLRRSISWFRKTQNE